VLCTPVVHTYELFLKMRAGTAGFSFCEFVWVSILCFSVLAHYFVTFRMSHRRREMYTSHALLCVSVHGRMPTLLHGPGSYLGEWQGVLPTCALLGGFAIGARVALLWQHSANAKCQWVLVLTLCLALSLFAFVALGLVAREDTCRVGCKTLIQSIKSYCRYTVAMWCMLSVTLFITQGNGKFICNSEHFANEIGLSAVWQPYITIKRWAQRHCPYHTFLFSFRQSLILDSSYCVAY